MPSVEAHEAICCLPPFPSYCKRTLHGRLCPRRSNRTHCPHHKVLKDQIAALALLAPITAEIRDLARLIVSHSSERRIERARCFRFAGRRGDGADGVGGERALGKRAQQRAGGVSEGRHREDLCGRGQLEWSVDELRFLMVVMGRVKIDGWIWWMTIGGCDWLGEDPQA